MAFNLKQTALSFAQGTWDRVAKYGSSVAATAADETLSSAALAAGRVLSALPEGVRVGLVRVDGEAVSPETALDTFRAYVDRGPPSNDMIDAFLQSQKDVEAVMAKAGDVGQGLGQGLKDVTPTAVTDAVEAAWNATTGVVSDAAQMVSGATQSVADTDLGKAMLDTAQGAVDSAREATFGMGSVVHQVDVDAADGRHFGPVGVRVDLRAENRERVAQMGNTSAVGILIPVGWFVPHVVYGAAVSAKHLIAGVGSLLQAKPARALELARRGVAQAGLTIPASTTFVTFGVYAACLARMKEIDAKPFADDVVLLDPLPVSVVPAP